jgi:hypothetical protein
MYRSTKEYSNNIYFVFSTYFWNLYQFLELKWKQKNKKIVLGPPQPKASGARPGPAVKPARGTQATGVWPGARAVVIAHHALVAAWAHGWTRCGGGGGASIGEARATCLTRRRRRGLTREPRRWWGGGAEVAARWRSTAMTHLVHEREVRHDFNVDGKIGWVGLTMRGRWLAFGFTKKCLFTMETRWKSIFHSCEAHIMSQIDTSVLYKKVYGF